MTTSATASVQLGDIRFIQILMDRAGLEEGAILSAAKLQTDFFTQPDDTVITFRTFFRLMEEMTDAAGDETVTASARRLRPGTAQLIVSGVEDGSTLEKAMIHIAHAYNVVHAGDYNSVHQRDNRLHYCIDDRGFPFSLDNLGSTRHAFMESTLLFLNGLLSELANQNLVQLIERIDTRRPRRDAHRDAFLTCWPVPIRYGAPSYAIHFAPAAHNLRVQAAARTELAQTPVYRVVARRISNMFDIDYGARTVWSEQVRNALQKEDLDQPRLARRLGVSTATLRRHLVDEGTSFREIKGRLYHARAKHLLSCGHTVQEVSDLLNYSDIRAFSRAFKARQLQSPSAYQRGLQAGPAVV
jgi:AraC-like DNA-binding protein